MPESNFLLVDLNEPKTKKLAETITSETSRKLLNHLAEKEDTEANIAKELQIPISTVHYHLQKLQEAGLVIVKEFHYSSKGREVNHYRLANKYIIIAPQKVSGLKEKLKGILPVGIIMLGISAVVKLVQSFAFQTAGSREMLTAAVEKTAAAPLVSETALNSLTKTAGSPDLAGWFFLGSVVTIAVYLAAVIIREYWKR